MIEAPDCTCMQLTGAHDEKCAYIKYVRSADYEPDLEIPVALRRPRDVVAGVFD